MQRLSKMLMNAVGSSPGGGAPPGSGAPAAAPAQGGSVATVPLDQVQTMIDNAVAQAKHGIFADLRRTGSLKGKAGARARASGNGGGSNPQPGSAGAGAAPDVDVNALVQRATAFERFAVQHSLTDAQRKRMDAALRAENPTDVDAWAKSYLEDMGIAKPAPNNQSNQNTNGGAPGTGSARGPSSSDRGAPGRDNTLAHDGAVWKMSAPDVAALVREKGFQAAAHELKTRLKHDLRGVRLTLSRPRS